MQRHDILTPFLSLKNTRISFIFRLCDNNIWILAFSWKTTKKRYFKKKCRKNRFMLLHIKYITYVSVFLLFLQHFTHTHKTIYHKKGYIYYIIKKRRWWYTTKTKVYNSRHLNSKFSLLIENLFAEHTHTKLKLCSRINCDECELSGQLITTIANTILIRL